MPDTTTDQHAIDAHRRMASACAEALSRPVDSLRDAPDANRTASAPLTICHPVWQLGRGGLEIQLRNIVRHLGRDRLRHVVVVRALDAGMADISAELGPNVTVIGTPDRRKDRFWSVRLAAILKEHRVDILHVRGLAMLIDAALARKMYHGVRLAFSFHGFESADPQFGTLRRNAYRAAIQGCDAAWAVSRAAADALAELLDLPPERFAVIHNGVDTTHYVPAPDRLAVRRSLDLPEDRPIILSVGNLKPIKGHDLLIRAMERLAHRADNTMLVFVGHDHQQGHLQTLARRLLPNIDVCFVGAVANLRPWYQAADLFVLPSRSEGMPNALLEAMACGVPAIATSVGGVPEIIRDGTNGLLVPPDDIIVLANAIRALLVDRTRRRVLGGAGQLRVRTAFARSRMLEQYAYRYFALARQRWAGPPSLRITQPAAPAKSPVG